MQDTVREVIKRINQLMRRVPNISVHGVMKELKTIADELDDMTLQYPELRLYELTVSGVDVPDDIRVIQTVLPTMFAELAIAGKSKPDSERTGRERAAMALLPVAVEEVYDATFAIMPRMTARNVSIRPVDA